MHSLRVSLHLVITSDLAFLAYSKNPVTYQVVDKHLVGYYTIQYMEHGSVQLAYDDRRFAMDGSWFWPAYPGPRIFFTSARGRETWHHRHVAFHGPLVSRWISEGLWPTGPQPVDQGFALKVDQLIELVRRGDSWAWRRGINLLEGMLLELAEARAGEERGEAWLAEALRGMEGFDPDFEQIAHRLGMAGSTLRRRFRAAMGVSLQEHLITSRIVRAKALLMDSDLTLEAISSQLGYDNAAFFSRQFKQRAGVPPSVFRRSRT
jgi:AraC-like DNA-binding protein